MNKMKRITPPESWLAKVLNFLGMLAFFVFFVCMLLLVLGLIYPSEKPDDSVFFISWGSYFLIGSLLCVFISIIIEKFWNIEFYLEHLANNSHQPDYKPLSKERKPQPNKPSNPQSDMRKYAPK